MRLSYLIDKPLNESISVDSIIDRTIKELESIEVVEINPVIEAFLMFAETYSNNSEAINELKKLGTYEFQNSRDDKWDEEGVEGDEYKDVTWGDLADLTLDDINEYQQKKNSKVSLDKIKKLEKILNSLK